jgi:hypothetical protein
MLTSAQLLRGEYTEDTNTVITVKKDTALLFLPYEDQIPVGPAHTDLVKFSSKSDATYQTIVRHICQCRDNTGKYIPLIISESENCQELNADNGWGSQQTTTGENTVQVTLFSHFISSTC